jgi:DNA-binding NarL/FixJ family response regulator
MAITLILGDDHAVVRDGIKAILGKAALEISVIGEAANGKEVLALAGNRRADIYLLDIGMPVLNGMVTADRLLKMDPHARIIFLSMYDSRTFVEQAMKLGVKGYVLKENASEEIAKAVDEVYSGRRFLSARLSAYVSGLTGRPPGRTKEKGVTGLTSREKEILQLISEGHGNKEIAYKLKRSVNTVNVHRKNIMRKLDIHNQPGLVRFALKEGLSHI